MKEEETWADLVSRSHDLQRLSETLSADQLCRGSEADELRPHGEAVAAMESFLGLTEDGQPGASIPVGGTNGSAAACHCPTAIGGYEVLGELGRGGMGVVYKARQRSLDRVVALKMILAGGFAGPDHLARFRVEAEAVARVQHPNIVHVYEVGEHAGCPFLSLEFVDGGSLEQKLAGKPLPARQAAGLVETLAQAMHHAHERGIIHRDIKPSNILVATDGTIKITDFGLAKRLDNWGGQTQSDAILGTPSYMAPEQAAGNIKEIGTASDVYALGVVLYECLTGRPPFKAATIVETLQQVRTLEPVAPSRLVPKLPLDLETICLTCLHKEPRGRYASAAALADDLRRFLDGEPVQARPVGLAERWLKWARRCPAEAAAYSLAVLVLTLGGMGGGVTWLWQNSEQAREQLADQERQSEAARQEAESARARLAEVSNLHRVGLAHQEWQDAEVARAEQLLASCPPEMRGWEWRYVQRLCHKELCTLNGHTDGVMDVAFSPDGKRLATASADHTVRIWDSQTSQEVLTCRGHTASVNRVAFSPDGLRLASVGRDQTVRVWDPHTGQEIFAVRHTDILHDVAFSPDGCGLVTASQDGTAQLWDARHGQALRVFKGLPGVVCGVAFSPDSRLIAGGCATPRQGEVRIWDAQTGEEVLSIKYTDQITSLAFSPDGRRLACASIDRTVQVWDAQTGRRLLTLSGHTDPVNRVAFSPDGTRLASASADQTARVWDATTGQEVASHKGHKRGVAGVAFSSDGQCLASASGDGTVKIWRAAANPRAEVLCGHSKWISHVKVSPDGQTIASSGTDGTLKNGTIETWDVRSKRQLLSIRAHDRMAQCVTFSPDSTRLVSGGNDRLVKVWYAKTGQQVLSLSGHSASVLNVAFSPDGTRIASAAGSYDKQGSLHSAEAKVWDAQTGRELFTLLGETEGLNCVAFSPNGKRLVCGGDRGASVWDARTGQQLLSFRAHDDSVVDTAFSPDGERFATASYDKTVKVWDALSGEPIRTISGHTARVTCVTFSPDGQRLVSGGDDRRVRITVASTGEEALCLKVPLGPVHSVAFSPSGDLLVSGGWDSCLRVWDARPLHGAEGDAAHFKE